MAKNEKTNVMRVLEQHKIAYEGHNYLDSGVVAGMEVDHGLKRSFSAAVRLVFRWRSV